LESANFIKNEHVQDAQQTRGVEKQNLNNTCQQCIRRIVKALPEIGFTGNIFFYDKIAGIQELCHWFLCFCGRICEPNNVVVMNKDQTARTV